MMIAGWVLTLGVTAFMFLDVSYDLRQVKMAVDANAAMGIPADAVLTIGLVGLGCTLLYLFPPTATLGAILLTGFLGGAVVTHLRVHGSLHDMGENVLIGVFAWSGLWCVIHRYGGYFRYTCNEGVGQKMPNGQVL
jgi:hypothetical protein